jgi:hypothetical protein
LICCNASCPDKGSKENGEAQIISALHLLLKLFGGLWIAILTVVLLTINAAAFAIQLALQSSALTRSDMSVHPGKSLVGSDPCFSCFEASSFATGQLAAADALIDALLLVTFSRID